MKTEELDELKRIFGEEKAISIAGVFDNLRVYMNDPCSSFDELTRVGSHRRGRKMTQDTFERSIRESDVVRVLEDYMARLSHNLKAELNPRIERRDIALILSEEIPAFHNQRRSSSNISPSGTLGYRRAGRCSVYSPGPKPGAEPRLVAHY